MLAATRRVNDLYDNDEFKIFIITGDHGYGKTSYANKIIAEVYSKDGVHRNWNTEMFKRHLGFHPSHVLNNWMGKLKRDKVYHWDDAGLWLNALDYQDPFVKEVGKYLQVARTDWACIIFTCIDREDIVNKVRSLRHAITIDITKEGKSHKEPNKRKATAITHWKGRNNKTGYNYEWEENFNCHVPNKFYSWYNPLRKEYSDMAKRLMIEKLKRKTDIMKYEPELHI